MHVRSFGRFISKYIDIRLDRVFLLSLFDKDCIYILYILRNRLIVSSKLYFIDYRIQLQLWHFRKYVLSVWSKCTEV